MLLGETEILGQLKAAYEVAKEKCDDLAGNANEALRSATLLIVGERDVLRHCRSRHGNRCHGERPGAVVAACDRGGGRGDLHGYIADQPISCNA